MKSPLLLALYFCQGLPGGFLAVAIPVMMRERQASFRDIGFAVLLNLPWLVKFLWAPLADRFYWARFGRRKSWIVPAQMGMIAVTLALAVVVPERDVMAIAALFLILNLFASIQDIGVDGLAVDILGREDLGRGNAAQVSGFKLGNLFGGGVLLALAGFIGWSGDFLVMSACVAAVAGWLVLIREEKLHPDRSPAPAGTLGELWGSVRTAGFGFLLFLFYAKFGESFGGWLVKPVLSDHGFSRDEIAVLDGVFGGIATVLGGFAAAFAYRWFGLRRALAGFSLLQAGFLIGFALASLGPLGFWSATALNGIENFAGGGVGVCVFILAMASCRASVGAGSFTLFQCTCMSGLFAAPPLAGMLAERIGPVAVMIASGVMAASLAPIVLCGRLPLSTLADPKGY